ncbi:hypothetical protein T06_9738 [Trichinella sp. T6]|nr:hypothetical protein T06_9738 [Trichinella sp. T6]
MQKESLRCDLVFIAKFANFVQAFTFLEKRSETLVDRLQVFDKKLKEFWVVFPYSFDHAALSTCKELLNGDTTEDDSTTSPPRISGRFFYNGHPAAYQITAIGQQRMNQLHEHRQFKGDSSLMDTQPYV